MKRILSIILVICILLSFASCRNKEKLQEAVVDDTPEELYLFASSKEKYYPGDIIDRAGFDGTNQFGVMVNGHYYKNFEIVNEDEDVVSLKSNGGGILLATNNSGGCVIFEIKTEKHTFAFVWNNLSSDSLAKEKQYEIRNTEYSVIGEDETQIAYEIVGPDKRIEFNSLLEQVNAEHEERILTTENLKGLDQYLLHKKGEVSISKKEIDNLLSLNVLQPTVTNEQAKEDIDLYFRALKYGYGGYYYFGEDNFAAAKNAILDYIGDKSTIIVEDLINEMQQNLQFVRDGHFKVDNKTAINDVAVRYAFYYSDIDFSKDDTGYYVIMNDQKWYYSSCANENVNMDEFLREDGILTYRLRQFCPSTIAHKKDNVELINGEVKTDISVKWTHNIAYAKSNDLDYNLFKENGIAYVSVRSFDFETFDTKLKQYAADGALLKDAKLIIYDLRSNCGGSDEYSKEWVTNLTGQEPSYPITAGHWSSYCWQENGGKYNAEHYAPYIETPGKIINNDIPIIILIDDAAGSSGESALLFAETLKNSIIVGSNSAGYQLCGNAHDFTLPNTGIPVTFSQNIGFAFDMTNVDGKGYEPDVWCNPQHALNAVIKMLENYNLSDAEAISSLREFVRNNTTD